MIFGYDVNPALLGGILPGGAPVVHSNTNANGLPNGCPSCPTRPAGFGANPAVIWVAIAFAIGMLVTRR